MATVLRLEFAESGGDQIVTDAVALVSGGVAYSMRLDFLPLADEEQGAWAFTMSTPDGAPIVSGALLRDRVDALGGIVNGLRPPGAIMPYNPIPGSGDPRRYAFEREGWRLYYLPDGYDPADFTDYALVT